MATQTSSNITKDNFLPKQNSVPVYAEFYNKVVTDVTAIKAELVTDAAAILALQTASTFNSTSASIVAAGANQGNATAITTGVAVVGAADDNKGVVLPAVGTTKVVTIFNTVGGKILKIYPASGEYVNAALVNVPATITHATLTSSVVCTYASAGHWTVTAIFGTLA